MSEDEEFWTPVDQANEAIRKQTIQLVVGFFIGAILVMLAIWYFG